MNSHINQVLEDDGYRKPEATFNLNSMPEQMVCIYRIYLYRAENSDKLMNLQVVIPLAEDVAEKFQTHRTTIKRDSWGSDMEFLMSCIALSVGLGNVWRFPFAALENGGGAFLIPYLVVLVVVGKPLYYLEMIMGQFSSRGSIQVYDFAPALRGLTGLFVKIFDCGCVKRKNYRNWIWTSVCNGDANNILCVPISGDATLFLGIVSVEFTVEPVQR